MDTVICKELIVSTIARRGKGTEHSPIRIITQVFEKDGTLIAENDPAPETFNNSDMRDFAVWCKDKNLDQSDITLQAVNAWLSHITKKSGS